MAEMFVTLGSWNWLIFGVLLMALELLAPGVFMFWLGLSAFLVGVLSFIVTPSWQVQILLFGLFALAAVPLWRRIARQKPGANPNPFLNKRSDALVGRICTLDRPIIDGEGIVRIDDTVWRVSGPDTPAGTQGEDREGGWGQSDGGRGLISQPPAICSTAPQSDAVAGRCPATPGLYPSAHSRPAAARSDPRL
jgi:membrane protein implicated in regulation of membrane protease activity